MKKLVLSYIHGYTQLHDSNKFSEGVTRRIQFVNYIALISIVTMMSYVFLYMTIDVSLFLPAIIFLSVSSLLIFGIISLNNQGYFMAAKIGLALLNPLFMGSVATWLFGKEPGFHTFLFAAMIIPMFLWSVKELKYLLIFSGFSLFIYLFIEFSPQLFKPLILLPDEWLSTFKSSNILITFCSAALAIIVYFDLSSRQEKHLLQQTKELERSQQHRDLVYSIVAHDLRSPIARLFGLTDVLLQLSEDKKDSQELKYLKNIYDSSKSLNNLLDNLLNWSKMHSGNMSIKRQAIDLRNKVNEVETLLQNLITKKSVRFSNHIDPETKVFADVDMLGTVFRNLISNAIKFTNEGGRIIVTGKPGNRNVEICIQDTGVGISDENLNLLFNENEHISTLDTNKEKGNGLGLKLCKDFIEANKGRIWAESELDKGSKFFVTLPLDQAKAGH